VSASIPALSVIVPLAYNLRDAQETFEALAASDLPRRSWELIVVASTQAPEIVSFAAQYADAIVRVGGHHAGSAHLCNRGASIARGPVLVFFDRDVAVLPDTLSRIDDAFVDPGLTAIVGAIASAPPTATLPTRYRALVRQWAQRRSAGLSEHFATCCGAIRASAFIDAGQLDEWRCPAIGSAAAQLGLRLRAEGRRIELRTDVRVVSRRRTTWLRATQPVMILTSPPPWMSEVAEEGPIAPIRRLRLRERWLAAAVWVVALLVTLSITTNSPDPARAAAVLGAAIVLVDLPLFVHIARGGGIVVLCAALPLRAVSLLSTGARGAWHATRFRVVGEPRPEPGMDALSEVGARTWPPDAN
jgi:hypothetical protein